jgi:hypothetical protein
MPTGTSITPLMLFAMGLGGFILGSLCTVVLARLRPRALGLTDRSAVSNGLQALQADLVAELRTLERGSEATMSRPRPAPPIRMVPRANGEARREAA